jgi:hypothetical protein
MTKDWLATSRIGQLATAKDWAAVLGVSATAWNVPAGVLTELSALIQAAETALITVQTETTRSPVSTAQCRVAFDALVEKMRDMKRRYFLTPPLTEVDYISLGLKPHDLIPTHSGNPTAQCAVDTYLTGRHELGVRIIYETGDPDDPANKGYRLWYTVVAPGETPPANPDELRKSFFTKRKKDVIIFEFDDSGKTVYFAVQIENEGKKGPWGPLTSALIP